MFHICEIAVKVKTVNVTEWLASPGGNKLSKLIEEMSKEELNVFQNSFCTSARKKRLHTVSLQKFINEIHLRAAIDLLFRSLPLNKPFSVISAFSEANKALEHLPTTTHKRAILPAY